MSDTSGQYVPGATVLYTGTQAVPGITMADLPCNPSMDDIVSKLGQNIEDLKGKLSLAAVKGVNSCFAFNATTAAQKDFFKEVHDKICGIQTEVTTLSTALNALQGDLTNMVITGLDLKCLVSNPNPCGPTVTVKQVLQLLINKACE